MLGYIFSDRYCQNTISQQIVFLRVSWCGNIDNITRGECVLTQQSSDVSWTNSLSESGSLSCRLTYPIPLYSSTPLFLLIMARRQKPIFIRRIIFQVFTTQTQELNKMLQTFILAGKFINLYSLYYMKKTVIYS